MSRYAIWNKTDKVVTPIGEVLTPAQWIERYPVADILDTVCGGTAINGAFFAVYDSMKEMYASQGCDFSDCTTQQECLDAIEAFEDAQNAASADVVTDEARIADALEDIVVLREVANSESES